MGNYYHKYYQGGHYKPKPGLSTKICVNEMRIDNCEITGKQKVYFNDLLNFLRENGLDTSLFERPRNKRDCSSKIRAMNTLLEKHGLHEKFYARGKD